MTPEVPCRQESFTILHDCSARILKDSTDCIIRPFFRTPTFSQGQDVSKRKILLAGKGLGNDDICIRRNSVRTAFQKVITRYQVEKRAIHSCAPKDFVIPISGSYRAHSGHCLYFRNLSYHVRKPIGKPWITRQSRQVDQFPVRILPCHCPLLPDVTADQDHEREAHRQPHRLDGGVELVAA